MQGKAIAVKYLVIPITVALALSAGSPAFAQNAGKSARTPAGWSYDIRNGQRVPKANRIVREDGSWTEEVKQGNCKVTREGRDGEVREVRTCG